MTKDEWENFLYLMTECSVPLRCPNLLSLTLSGCGHVTDQDLVPVLQSCRKLRLLHLENCSRVTDSSLEGAARHGHSLQRVTVDFCRNVTQAGLQAVRERRPEIQLSAVRSAEMIPDRKPEALAPIRSALPKVLLFSWWICFQDEPNITRRVFPTLFLDYIYIPVL